MNGACAVALVEDDEDMRAATAQLLRLAGHDVGEYTDGLAAATGIDAGFEGVVLSDIRMPGMSGIELFRTLRERDAELPVILVTGHADVGTAVEALKAGAWDFLVKPSAPETLLASVARAGTARALVMENRRLRALAEAAGEDELIGRSPVIRRLRASVPAIAATDLDVVIEGATGTGKHLLARLIHRSGGRARRRFAVLDCAAAPGAGGRDPLDPHGIVARADRGTLLLDHLDRADTALQHRLAQFAEHRAIALDAREPIPIDVRIVATIDDGGRDRILPALYHRLAAVSVRIPPLAERGEDIPLLIAHLLPRLARQHRRPEPAIAAAADLIARQDWPGNVREMEMAVERLVLGLDRHEAAAATGVTLPERVRSFERAAIVDAVMRAEGDVSVAARTLGLPRETFYYRVKRLGIDLARLRTGQR